MSEPELHRREAPSMFLTASEPAQEARAGRALPRMQATGAPLDGVWLPVAAFFLALAVGWLMFSGTAARLLEPRGVTELRDLQKIEAYIEAPARRAQSRLRDQPSLTPP